jgi:hypothetical protein
MAAIVGELVIVDPARHHRGAGLPLLRAEQNASDEERHAAVWALTGRAEMMVTDVPSR